MKFSFQKLALTVVVALGLLAVFMLVDDNLVADDSTLFTFDGKTYEKFLTVTSSVNYNAKLTKTIEIYYNKSNPEIISTDPAFPTKTVGWVLVIASPIVLILNLVYTYFVLKNKSFATVMGGVGAVSDVAQLF